MRAPYAHSLLAVAALVVAAALMVGGLAPVTARPLADTQAAQIDAYIASVRATVPIPGVGVAVVRGSGPVYVQGYGQAAPGRAVTPQTPFWIASLAKPFTALAVRQLANAGRIDLEAPVQQYLPAFTLADPAVAARIRVRHLLAHTSGIPNRAGNDVYFDASPRETRADLLRRLATVTPGQLGEREYSNYNYVVLGALIEAVTGQGYEAYLQEHVLAPLGMEHTHLSLAAAKADGVVSGYRLLFGAPVPWDEPFKPAMQSSGYILSSIEDMGRFAQLYLTDGLAGEADLVGARPENPEGFYSIYWDWIGGPTRQSTPEHEGGMLTTSTAIRIFPADDLAIVVLLNCRPDATFGNLNAGSVLGNVAGIMLGSGANPPNDRGWARNVQAFNLRVGAFLAAGLLAAALTGLWRARFRAAPWAAGLAMVLAVAEAELAAFGLIATPMLNATPWPRLLQVAPDLNGAVFGLALLYAALAAVQLATLWQSRRSSAHVRRRQLSSLKTA